MKVAELLEGLRPGAVTPWRSIKDKLQLVLDFFWHLTVDDSVSKAEFDKRSEAVAKIAKMARELTHLTRRPVKPTPEEAAHMKDLLKQMEDLAVKAHVIQQMRPHLQANIDYITKKLGTS